MTTRKLLQRSPQQSSRKKPEPIVTSSQSHVDEVMTSAATPAQNERQDHVISPPPDMRELVNDITKSLDTPTDELDHPLSPGNYKNHGFIPPTNTACSFLRII